jgi:hypothetical protein
MGATEFPGPSWKFCEIGALKLLRMLTNVCMQGLLQTGGSKTDGYELAPVQKDGKPSPVLLVPVLEALNDLDNIAPMVPSCPYLRIWRCFMSADAD